MNNNLSQEMCRMSWFLVELENSPKSYSIIHSVDLVVKDSSNLYIDRTVQFHRDSKILCGTIIAASDDRKFIETELRKFINAANNIKEPKQWFLVQYSKGKNNLIYSVINKNDIFWQADQNYVHREVYINCGNIQRPAIILCIADNEERVLTELQSLKKKCFDSAFEESNGNLSPESNQWYLVQYSCGTNDIVYAVINYNETVWRQENLYKEIVLYIRDGTTIYQAIIIKRSNNRDLLDFALANIKELCLLFKFPLEFNTNNLAMSLELNEAKKAGYETTVPSHSDSDCSLIEIDLNRQQEDVNERAKIIQRLDVMDLKMQQESSMISNAFKALDRVRRGMDQRLLVLDNMLNIL